jgi:hypothetical protein
MGASVGFFWEHPVVVVVICASVLFLAHFDWSERRLHRPMVGWPRFLLALVAAVAVMWLWHEYVGPMVD